MVLDREMTLTLPGRPAPKGSMKCIGGRGQVKHQLIEDHRPGQKEWRAAVTTNAGHRLTRHAEAGAPVAVEVTFTVDRPKAHHRSGRNAHLLTPKAPQYPTGHATNDVDKMARLILDALTDAGVLDDDAQVVELTARKTYSTLTDEQRADLRGPVWAADHHEIPDALDYPGARIRVRGYRPAWEAI